MFVAQTGPEAALPVWERSESAAARAKPRMPELPLTVLVAEDHDLNRKLAGAFLAVGGHIVHYAEDGAEAVRKAAERRFDLILMDVRMPVLDGLEATRRIRALRPAEHAAVPIFAISANSQESDRRACEEAGMDGFLPKPIDRRALDAILVQAGAARRHVAHRAV